MFDEVEKPLPFYVLMLPPVQDYLKVEVHPLKFIESGAKGLIEKLLEPQNALEAVFDPKQSENA